MDEKINYRTALHVLKILIHQEIVKCYLLTQEGLLSIPAKNHYHKLCLNLYCIYQHKFLLKKWILTCALPEITIHFTDIRLHY